MSQLEKTSKKKKMKEAWESRRNERECAIVTFSCSCKLPTINIPYEPALLLQKNLLHFLLIFDKVTQQNQLQIDGANRVLELVRRSNPEIQSKYETFLGQSEVIAAANERLEETEGEKIEEERAPVVHGDDDEEDENLFETTTSQAGEKRIYRKKEGKKPAK